MKDDVKDIVSKNFDNTVEKIIKADNGNKMYSC